MRLRVVLDLLWSVMPLLNRAIDVLPDPMVWRVIHKVWKYQEPELRRLADYLPTDRTAVDIGTWWGPWTAAFAAQCPRVHSFEPQPQLAAKLRRWVPNHVTVHEAAVSDEPGQAVLHRPDALPGTDGLATLRATTEGPSQDVGDDTVEVETVTIDSCHLTDVGLIKIDVEGFELQALRGAEQTIARDRPALMIEIEQRHLDQPINTVFDWLLDREYEGHFLRGSTWASLTGFNVERDQTRLVAKPKSAEYINAFLFTPVEEHWSA